MRIVSSCPQNDAPKSSSINTIRIVTDEKVNNNENFTSIQFFYERYLLIKKVLIGKPRWNPVNKCWKFKATCFDIMHIFLNETSIGARVRSLLGNQNYEKKLQSADWKHVYWTLLFKNICMILKHVASNFQQLLSRFHRYFPRFPINKLRSWKMCIAVNFFGINCDPSNVNAKQLALLLYHNHTQILFSRFFSKENDFSGERISQKR